MSRVCPVSGRGVLVGNNVSHANNRTKRRFLPNLHPFSLLSDELSQKLRVRLSARGMRMVERAGGLDAYLHKHSLRKLDPVFHGMKKLLERRKKTAEKAAN